MENSRPEENSTNDRRQGESPELDSSSPETLESRTPPDQPPRGYIAVEKAELPAFVREIDPAMWKSSFIYGLALLGVAIAFNAAILVLTGLFTGWELWGPTDALSGGPFALLVLSSFGSLSSTVDIFVEVPLALSFVPLLSTIVLVVAAVFLAKRIGASSRPAHYGSSVLLSVAPALAIAALTTVVSLIFPVGVVILNGSLTLAGASVGNFFRMFLVFSVLIFVLKTGPEDDVLRGYFNKTVDWIGRSSLAGGFFFIGFTGVLLAVFSLFSDLDLIPWDLTLLLIGVFVASGAAIAALGSVELATGFFGIEVGVFSDSFEALEIVGIVLTLAVGLALTGPIILLRRGGRLGDPTFWIRTPVAFAILGVAVTLASTVQVGGLGQAVGVAAAAWSFALFALWGAVAEAFTRYTGAYVVKLFPGALQQRLMGPAV